MIEPSAKVYFGQDSSKRSTLIVDVVIEPAKGTVSRDSKESYVIEAITEQYSSHGIQGGGGFASLASRFATPLDARSSEEGQRESEFNYLQDGRVSRRLERV